MPIAMRFTKLVVADLDGEEAFYTAMGLKVVSRNQGGEDVVHQQQVWLSATVDMQSHVLILSRFVELPPPARPAYPGEAWLTFSEVDVDTLCALCEARGGRVVRAPQDRPEHAVRAAVIADPEGHHIELVGPMADAR
jgi:catechol 2,3-dioxygenase-like lactoylglutathione lyase family enzyme